MLSVHCVLPIKLHSVYAHTVHAVCNASVQISWCFVTFALVFIVDPIRCNVSLHVIILHDSWRRLCVRHLTTLAVTKQLAGKNATVE
jgi:hypothetical protein